MKKTKTFYDNCKELVEINYMICKLQQVCNSNDAKIKNLLDNSSALFDNSRLCTKYLGESPGFLFRNHCKNKQELSSIIEESNDINHEITKLMKKDKEIETELTNQILELNKFELLRGEVLENVKIYWPTYDGYRVFTEMDYVEFRAYAVKRDGSQRFVYHQEEVVDYEKF
jgi:hypothetical protein